MTPTTAIQRAEQWRKENACGEAAKVAIALLNELERVQASQVIPEGRVVVPGWQPIETAPKDHTEIFAAQCGAPESGVIYWDEVLDSWIQPADDWSQPNWKPTHWMPLPAAPAPEGEA